MERGNLSKERRRILSEYLEEMIGVRVTFKKEQECSGCEEVGWVPTHHRCVCVFCYVAERETDRYHLCTI